MNTETPILDENDKLERINKLDDLVEEYIVSALSNSNISTVTSKYVPPFPDFIDSKDPQYNAQVSNLIADYHKCMDSATSRREVLPSFSVNSSDSGYQSSNLTPESLYGSEGVNLNIDVQGMFDDDWKPFGGLAYNLDDTYNIDHSDLANLDNQPNIFMETLNSPMQQPTVTRTDITEKVDQETHPSHLHMWWLDTTTTPNASSHEIQSETFGVALGSEYEGFDTDSESEAFTDCSDSLLEWDIDGVITKLLKQEYIRRLLLSFDSIRPNTLPMGLPEEAIDNSDQPSSSKRPATSSLSDTDDGTRSTKKVKIRSSRNGDDGDGENDGKESSPSSSILKQDSQSTLFFACPFVKRYPSRYRECYSHILRDVSRVKQHLREHRIHRIPLYCARCSQTFDTEEFRDEHVREGTCPKNPKRCWEGITVTQRSQLKRRSRFPRESEESWFEVWNILFPGVSSPSTPYVDMSLVENLRVFREHLLSEGPIIWNEILQTRLPDHLAEHREELQSFHEAAYPELVAEICARWQSNHAAEHSSMPFPQDLEPTSSLEGGESNGVADSALGNSISSGSQTGHESHPTASTTPVSLTSSTLQTQTLSEPPLTSSSLQSPPILTSVSAPAQQEHVQDLWASIDQLDALDWQPCWNQATDVQPSGMLFSDQDLEGDYGNILG